MTLEDTQRRAEEVQRIKEKSHDLGFATYVTTGILEKRIEELENRISRLEKIPSPPIVVKERNDNQE